MGQAGGGNDRAHFMECGGRVGVVSGGETSGHVGSERATDTRDLQAMREPVVYENATRQGEDLRLVLEPSEGGGEDQPIVIALEVGALMLALVIGFDAESAA